MRRFWLAAALTLPACAGDATPGDDGESGTETGGAAEWELPPIDPAICEDLSFSNAVDEASCDEIQGRGIEPELADDVEICRRLYVDLLGRLPTSAEYDLDCEGRSVASIVDDFMGRPEYVRLGQRHMADQFRMTSDETLFNYIVELDDIVAQLYRGDINLPRFAELSATHPGFTMRFDGEDRPGYAFDIFLGRSALVHEREGLEPLWHMWEERYEDEHPQYYFGYSRAVISTLACMSSFEQNCVADLWGEPSLVIPPLLEGDWDYMGPNVINLEDLTNEQWQQLRLPGRLIAERPSFYEHAADAALQRYLGYAAGDEIPLVRQALADLLSGNGGAIRPLEREILTSQLYTMSYVRPDEPGTPLEQSSPNFWRGPLKQLTAEAWLDSVGAFTGIDPGSCDHRFPNVQGAQPPGSTDYLETKYHPNDYPKDPTWPADSNRPDTAYRDMASLLGGCPDQVGQLRFTGSGVMIAIAEDAIGQAFCATVELDAPIVPPNLLTASTSVADLTSMAEHMVEAASLRPVTEEELTTSIEAAVEGCRDDAACDPLVFAFHLCNATLKSASVLYY